MTTEFDPYARALPGIGTLAPYSPGMPLEELERRYRVTDSIKLASNENPLGPSPKAVAAIKGEVADTALYPDGNGWRLKEALAQRHGVRPEQLTLGNGSNEVLELVVRTFVGAGEAGVISQYCFVVYFLALKCVQAEVRVVDSKNFGHDLEAMARQVDDRTRVVFVANPNNPTGTWSRADEVRRLLDRVAGRAIVVIDEAYAEYVDEPDYPDCASWLDQYPNLVVTRTFSKIFGLAGLRVGYAISSEGIADLLNRVRAPFNVNSLALAAARVSLEDHEHVRKSRELNSRELARLSAEFNAMGFETIESVANFVSVDMGRDANGDYEAMLRSGVIVRPLASYRMPNHLRVTVGTERQNDRLLSAFRSLVS